MKNTPSKVTRRGFLRGIGTFTAGMALGAGSLGLMGGDVSDAAAAVSGKVECPLPYAPLDPERVRKKGHLGCYEGHCAQGAFYALISELREQVGAPYTGIPYELMAYGAGGVMGWGTLCGALNGSCAVLSLIGKPEQRGPLCDELFNWYTSTAFPTDISNQYAVNHEFLVDKYKSDAALPQCVPTSPLCHVNVTNWCKDNCFSSGSPERGERCSRMVGDVAAYAAELLNRVHAGTFKPVSPVSECAQNCRACHSLGQDFPAGGWTRGKMDCNDCHNAEVIRVVGPDHY